LTSKKKPRIAEFKNEEYKPNVCFFIASQEGREIEDHLPIDTQVDK